VAEPNGNEVRRVTINSASGVYHHKRGNNRVETFWNGLDFSSHISSSLDLGRSCLITRKRPNGIVIPHLPRGARDFSERIFPAGFTLGRPHPEGPESSITVTPTPQSRLRMTTRPAGYESASIVLSILPVFLLYLITALR